MGKYTYSPGEEKILKVMKINQEDSLKLLHDSSSKRCDARIAESEKLLQSLGYDISQIPRNAALRAPVTSFPASGPSHSPAHTS